MTLLEQAFQAAQKLPSELQDEIARQLLVDIQAELRWQEALSTADVELGGFRNMARTALVEDDKGETEDKGFGEDI